MQIIKTVVSLIILSTSFLLHASEVRTSTTPNRSASILLDSSTLSGDVYIYAESTQTNTKQVRFYLDSATSAPPTKIENKPAYDFAGTQSNGNAIAFDTTTIVDGLHTMTVELESTNGTIEVLESQFRIANSEPRLLLAEQLLSATAEEGNQTLLLTTTLSASNSSTHSYVVSESTPWLNVSSSETTTPATINVSIDTSGLLPGEYNSVIEFSATGLLSTQLSISLMVTAQNSGTYQILVSNNNDRSSADTLVGTTLSGNTHIFVSPETDIKQVQFFLNKPTTTAPTQTENKAPYDLAGTLSNSNAISYDTTTLPDGSHTLVARIVKNDLSEELITSNFDVSNSQNGFLLSPSTISEEAIVGSSPIVLNILLGLNATSDGSSPVYSAISSHNWLTVTPTSSNAPETLTVTLDPAGLPTGIHTATIEISAQNFQTATLPVTLSVSQFGRTLDVSNQSININSAPDAGVVSRTINLSTSDGSATSYTTASDVAWLTSNVSSGVTPDSIVLDINTNGLVVGSYQGVLTISASGYDSVNVTVNITVSAIDQCAPVVCSSIKVSLPYELTFDTDSGHIKDASGVGTGFTYIQPTTSGVGLLSNNIELDTVAGQLKLTTTQGIQFAANNNQDNAVGVGFAGPNQITDISTTLITPPAGSGSYEQTGLWFGFDEDNYVKFVLVSKPTGDKIEFLYEANGARSSSEAVDISSPSSSDITFRLIADPTTQTVTSYFSTNGGVEQKVSTIAVSSDFFSFDAAGIDPQIGTRSFTGLFATSRNNTTPLTYTYDHFTVKETLTPPDTGSFQFSRKSHSLSFPTSMVWAPDGRLYVTELFGTIHALTYDENLNVIDDEIINSLTAHHGGRLTLGITYHADNPSDPSEFSLWVSHSSPSVDNGVANSGSVSKLSGNGFSIVEDVITGLPRAIANHAPNSLHFGPDDRLYITIGGNTGAGAPVNVTTEFGDRGEQPLSAALVVADVFAPSFDGSCANNADIYGPTPCDVVTYSTGLRNAYDFAFHSNGSIYTADNGLGVTGAFPAQPFPDCSGFANPAPWNNGGQNPLEQPDLLLRLQEGKFYGHPNPSIDECVFKDGSYQGVSPSLNYEAPMAIIGTHTSSNGIIEYKSSKTCGQLTGNLLITNYSLGDNIVRVVLDSSGTNVVSQESLVGGFNDPLTLSENSNGDLFVAEFGSAQITALRNISDGCWTQRTNAPIAILDAAATPDNDQMYVIGGKTLSGPINSLFRYDTLTDTWAQLADKPGIAVENPAAVTVDGNIYVFGGSTAPFSGALASSYKYDIASDTWSPIADMPSPRGGIRAELIGGKIYIAGGMSPTGASVTTLEIYDPSTNLWTSGPNMLEARDNPGTAVILDKLYVIGGRERLANGTTINGTKSSGEVYDPNTNTWSSITPMPTGRRTMAVGTIGQKIQMIGGEYNAGDIDNIFRQNEEYDPVFDSWTTYPIAPNPRHGAAYSTINNQLFVVGGGVKGGASYSNLTEVFSF